MRVLMTADTAGGVFDYAVELAAALAPRGVEVTLALEGPPASSAQRAELRRLRGVEALARASRLEWMADPWEDVAATGAWLLELAGRLRPDVVHLDSFAHAALPFPAPRLLVGHSCVPSWFEAVRGEAPPPAYDRYRQEVARGLAAAELVVAPTRWMLEALRRHHGPLPRARVIANGRSAARFQPGEKEPFVLCAGRLWDPAKNVAALDAAAGGLAWPVVVAGEATAPVVVAGEATPPMVAGEATAPVVVAGEATAPEPAGGAARLRHARALGTLSPDALAGWYRRAAIYAAPARYEPFGLSILEAALAGCALVLGDIPSLRETWGGAAVFVEPGAPDALRTVLAGIIERADLRALLGQVARARALRFTPAAMAREYLAAYGELKAHARSGAEASPCAS